MAQVFYSFPSLTPRQLPTLHLMRKLPNIGFQRNSSYWYKYVDGVFQLIQMDSSTFTFFWRRNINATAFCVHTNYYIEVFEKEIPYWQEPQDNYLYKKRRCRRTIFIQVLLLYQMSCYFFDLKWILWGLQLKDSVNQSVVFLFTRQTTVRAALRLQIQNNKNIDKNYYDKNTITDG